MASKSSSGILFFGCGKMGYAILSGLLKSGLDKGRVRVVEVDADIRKKLEAEGVACAENPSGFGGFSPGVVLLAVKPFLVEKILDDVKPFARKNAAVLSIVAGKKIGWFAEKLGEKTPVFRAMPNTPALVGEGIAAVADNGLASKEQREMVSQLFKACGDVIFLDDESLIDAVTALSGSGPAYVFYMTEALAQAGKALGLSEEFAQKLARATVSGAGALMKRSGESPETLRRNVTTPNGTTERALNVLMDEQNGLAPLLAHALKEACKRSKELGES